ncbi:MAG: phosphatidylglycerophosphatase A [Candidatus Tectomicrobia bacterium]|uniref:Phosphatidylglycerophosphatase A n=1 Tax=Tectimicrobiota bacterium TaxID=2528274 RepID=A0A932CQU9_UNCTE|nr:phosphatidylglycerophosphatase A [Candidatus Tectomicrobia bacterium]
MRELTAPGKGSRLARYASRLALFVATGAGIGYSPFCPGTVGTLGGVGLAWELQGISVPGYLLGALVLLGVGIGAAGKAERLKGQKDPSCVVIDEVVGFWFAAFLVPAGIASYALVFLLFRVLDIWKPVPRLELLPGGWGIMLDDVLAGILANLSFHSLRSLWYLWIAP